jgi:hypothetical protein
MTSPTTHPPCSPVAHRVHRTRRAAILTAMALAGGAGVSLLACGSKTGSVDAVTETGNPPFLDKTQLEVRAVDGKVVVAGRAGSVPGGAAVQLTNETSGDNSRTTADDEGAFEVEVSGDPGDELSLEVESGADSRSFDLSSANGAPGDASERAQCDSLYDAAQSRFNEALEAADTSCQQDADCVIATGGPVCVETCSAVAVSVTGQSTLEGARGVRSRSVSGGAGLQSHRAVPEWRRLH